MIDLQMDPNEVKALQDKFDSLTYTEMRGVIRSTLTQSAGILKRQTITNINNAPFRKSDQMKGGKGVKHKVRVNGVDTSFATVYLWSWLRMLEPGTKQRSTGKGYNRGSVKGYRFFASAKATTEGQVFSEMENRLTKQIEKKWEKNQK